MPFCPFAVVRDNIYAAPGIVGSFVFDRQVADVFDDMVVRSVPGYATSLELIAALAPSFLSLQPQRGYDLGCALGESSCAMLAATTDKACRIAAVDNAQPMLEGMQQRLAQRGENRIKTLQADMREVELDTASMIVLHLSLQFIAPDERARLLARCSKALVPEGGLLLFEKITAPPVVERAHALFKANNGYSQLEIMQKRQALEHVLVPESAATHEDRLKRCGFTRISRIFTALNFCGWLAQP